MINLFMPNKKTLFLIVGFGILIVVLSLVSLFSNQNPPITPSPPTFPVSQPSTSPPAYIEFTPEASDSVYKSEDLEKDYQRLVERKALSETDSKIRSQLIDSLGNESGYLTQTDSYRIEYVKSPDLFMVEITTENAEATKQEAQQWFREKGLSAKGICSLPVSFYLNSLIMRSFQEKNIFFNPIPEGCE